MSAQATESGLTQEDRDRAWLVLYRFNLDFLPDGELAWEREQWHRIAAPVFAEICDEAIHERRDEGCVIKGGASAADLDRLRRAVSMDAVSSLVEREAMTITEAVRLTYWAGLRSEVGR